MRVTDGTVAGPSFFGANKAVPTVLYGAEKSSHCAWLLAVLSIPFALMVTGATTNLDKTNLPVERVATARQTSLPVERDTQQDKPPCREGETNL
jgi:hypothetical protein